MTRKGKLIRNLAVTAAILIGFLWVCGVYLNPANCALASARQLYYGDCTIRGWGDTPDGIRIYILTNEKGAIFHCNVQRHFWLFWTTGSCGGGQQMEEGARVYIGRLGGGEQATVWCLRDTDETQTLSWYGQQTSVWHGDVATLTAPQESALYEPVEVYDAEGNLLWTDTFS